MITDKRLSELNCESLADYNYLMIAKYATGELVEASNLFLEANTRQQNNLLRSIAWDEDFAPSVQRDLYAFFDNLITE